jgi:hypothetical protein
MILFVLWEDQCELEDELSGETRVEAKRQEDSEEAAAVVLEWDDGKIGMYLRFPRCLMTN